jgi:hypothetical protein
MTFTHDNLTFTATFHAPERGNRGRWGEPLQPDWPAWTEIEDVVRAGVTLEYDEDLWDLLATVAEEWMR